jgi:hypothetical protein
MLPLAFRLPCSSGFSFVFVTEQSLSGEAATVVQFAVSQDTEESRFSGVDVADDGATNLHKILRQFFYERNKGS